MTKLGKILVLLNLAFSLGLMIWGVSLYVYRADLTDTQPKDGVPAGELFLWKEELKKAMAPLPQAESDWREARNVRREAEAQRRDTHNWYVQQLALLDVDAAVAKPTALQEIEVDVAAHQPVLVLPAAGDKDRSVKFKMQKVTDRKGGDLVAANVYDQREKNRFLGSPDDESDKIPIGFLAARQSLQNHIKRSLSGTTEMLGPKGLHSRLQDEKDKKEKLVMEQKLLEPLLINTAAESQFSREREKELRARVEELRVKLKELENRAVPAGMR